VTRLPATRRSDDPADDFLLAMAESGRADYLVTGDKAGLLASGRHHGTTILTARAFLDVLHAEPFFGAHAFSSCLSSFIKRQSVPRPPMRPAALAIGSILRKRRRVWAVDIRCLPSPALTPSAHV
jgi:hypothetical protein